MFVTSQLFVQQEKQARYVSALCFQTKGFVTSLIQKREWIHRPEINCSHLYIYKLKKNFQHLHCDPSFSFYLMKLIANPLHFQAQESPRKVLFSLRIDVSLFIKYFSLCAYGCIYVRVCPLSAGMTVYATASTFYGNTKNTNLGAHASTGNTVQLIPSAQTEIFYIINLFTFYC